MHHENYSIYRNEYPRGEANPTVSIRLIDKKKYKKYKKEKKIYLRNYDERMFDLERRIARKGCEENALRDKIIARGRSRRGNTWETRFYKRGQTSPIFAQAATNQIYIRSIILIYRNSIWFSTGFISWSILLLSRLVLVSLSTCCLPTCCFQSYPKITYNRIFSTRQLDHVSRDIYKWNERISKENKKMYL